MLRLGGGILGGFLPLFLVRVVVGLCCFGVVWVPCFVCFCRFACVVCLLCLLCFGRWVVWVVVFVGGWLFGLLGRLSVLEGRIRVVVFVWRMRFRWLGGIGGSDRWV